MTDDSQSFLVKLALFSIVTLGIILLLQYLATPSFETNLYWAIWLFFILITALIHFILIKTDSENPKKFVLYYLGITGIKLAIFFIILLIYGLLNRKHLQGFAICFLLSYFLYTGFEVAMLLKNF